MSNILFLYIFLVTYYLMNFGFEKIYYNQINTMMMFVDNILYTYSTYLIATANIIMIFCSFASLLSQRLKLKFDILMCLIIVMKYAILRNIYNMTANELQIFYDNNDPYNVYMMCIIMFSFVIRAIIQNAQREIQHYHVVQPMRRRCVN